jgi:hypothetical protein
MESLVPPDVHSLSAAAELPVELGLAGDLWSMRVARIRRKMALAHRHRCSSVFVASHLARPIV